MNRPSKNHPARRRLAVLAAALTLGLAAGAGAQPFGPHAGPAGADGMVARALQATKDRLNLNTSQQQGWDSAIAQSQAAFAAMRANQARVRAALQAELTKAEPDFAAVAALEDQVRQQNTAQRIAARGQWLTLYATLSPEQKAIVRDGIAARLARRDGMRERWHGRHHAGTGNG